jgi:hypothetical protein
MALFKKKISYHEAVSMVIMSVFETIRDDWEGIVKSLDEANIIIDRGTDEFNQFEVGLSLYH